MSSAARIAATAGSPTTLAAIAHCPKCQVAAAKGGSSPRPRCGVLRWRRSGHPGTGSLPARPIYCRSATSHLVFTLPAEVAPTAYQNKAVVYNLLYGAVSETLLTIAADPGHHPHLHMIVAGGGISLDGTRWVRCRPAPGFLLPVRVLSRLFRRLFLSRLADAPRGGRADVLRQSRQPAPTDGLRRTPRATQKKELVRLRQAALPPGSRRCSPISPDTPTTSLSRTAACSASTSAA